MESLRRLGVRDDGDGRATASSSSSSSSTLLTLPLSDFSSVAAKAGGGKEIGDHRHHQHDDDDDDDDDGLILISLPQSSDDSAPTGIGGGGGGGLTLDDLLCAENNNNNASVYILGDTSERDIPNHALLSKNGTSGGRGGGGGYGYGGTAATTTTNTGTSKSIEPVPARLIVEGGRRDGTRILHYGKTLELTRVETSNTYIVLPTSTTTTTEIHKMGGNKRQRISNGSSSSHHSQGQQENDDNVVNNNNNTNNQPLVSIPARSIGLVPGEDSPSCFFLDPNHLPPGHFAPTLRRILSCWMYDPFNPPLPPTEVAADEEDTTNTTTTSSSPQLLQFGYSIPEIAHICRTSIGEVEYAIGNRVFGAEDAMLIPSLNATPSSSTTTSSGRCCSRYGMLSEEGRQTVSMAIVSALLESDMTLIWFMGGAKRGHQDEEKEEEEEEDASNGMQLSILMKEIRFQWHQMEEGGEDAFRKSSSSQRDNDVFQASSNSQSSSQEDEDASQSYSQFGTPSQIVPSSTQQDVASSGEGGEQQQQQQLATEVIWHCLRPLCYYKDVDGNSSSSSNSVSTTNKDCMPEFVQLIPDQVAKLAAHQVFLSGTPRTPSLLGNQSRNNIASNNSSWSEEELLEEWSMRLPSMKSSRYEPRMELLAGVAISESKEHGAAGAGAGEGDDDANDATTSTRRWTYFPEVALPLDPAQRIHAMFVMRDLWTLSEAVPYLEKLIVMVPLVHRHEERVGGSGSKEGATKLLHSKVADLLSMHAKVVLNTGGGRGVGGGSTDLASEIKYMAKH